MKHDPGIHGQSWCQGRFTHSLCSGYRFDNVLTLNQIGIDVPSLQGKIEILCSCTCHNQGKMAAEDPHKFDAAFRTTISIFGTSGSSNYYQPYEMERGRKRTSAGTPTQKDLGSDIVILHTLIVMSNKSVADKILDNIDMKQRLNPQTSYIVYEQCYFFFLEPAMRIAFAAGGSNARDLIQDSLRSDIFMPIPIYLRARHRTHDDNELFDEWLEDLETPFWDRLDQAGLVFAQADSYPEMSGQLANRLLSELMHSGVVVDSDFESLVVQAVHQPATKIMSLVDAIGERLD